MNKRSLFKDLNKLLLFAMNRFENYTITAINKIRSGNKRPDTEKIFETITKKSALNISLDDALQKLREM